MKDTIYLVADKYGVRRMTKKLPSTYRGETIVKLAVTLPPEAFEPPTLSQEVVIEDWRQGIELEDIEFRHNFITEEEAATIRQNRLEKIKSILEQQGYNVEVPQND
jgi:hypothetical protein